MDMFTSYSHRVYATLGGGVSGQGGISPPLLARKNIFHILLSFQLKYNQNFKTLFFFSWGVPPDPPPLLDPHLKHSWRKP